MRVDPTSGALIAMARNRLWDSINDERSCPRGPVPGLGVIGPGRGGAHGRPQS